MFNKSDAKNIKAVGFDLDQTLYPKSSEIDEAIQTYLYKTISDHLNVSLEEAKKKFEDLYRSGKGLSGSKTIAALGITNAKDVVQDALENADIEKFLVPDQKMLNLLLQLKKKYESLDIVTGSNKEVAAKKLQKLKMDQDLFDHVISKTDGSKRDLSAYKIWMSLYKDLKPENFLYIGDRASSDYEAPKQLRIQTILVNQKENDPDVECLQLHNILELERYLLT